MSSVAQQYDAAGGAAKRQLQSYGVDPSSGRTAALDIGTRTGEAAASAAAGTQSDINRQTTGLGLEATALNIGNQLPGQATASNAGGTGAGAGAVNATTNSYSPYAGAIANPVAFGGLANQSLGLAGQLTGQQYQGQLSQYGANQNSSSGFGSLLGTAAGVGLSFLAKGGRVPAPGGAVSPDFPSSAARSSIPTASRTMSLPRGLHHLSAVPLTMKFADGGAVPAGLSPSGGAQTDDVQATVGQQGGPPQGGARINVGEFIMPKDVSDWYGTKFLQNMIMKARKEMGGAVGGGGPQQGASLQGGAPPQGQGAVPTGKPYAAGGSVGAIGGAVAGGVPPPRVATAAPHMPSHTAMRRPAPSRSMIAARGHTGALNLSPGAGGGAGPGVGMNLGGHQPPRPSMAVEGSNAGAVRTAVPGV
jgi:hypothetical protein